MPMHLKPIKLYVYQFIRDIYIFLYNDYRCSDIKYFRVEGIRMSNNAV